MPQYTLLMNRYIITYYQAELEARYKDLRNNNTLTVETFTNLASSLIETIGKVTFEAEWKKWNYTPTDSIYRLEKWMRRKLESLDTLYNFQ